MSKHYNERKREPSNTQGVCVLCEERVQSSKGIDKRSGKRVYRAICNKCHTKKLGTYSARKARVRFRAKEKKMLRKGSSCSSCGFVAVHTCQLDIDHVDGNHSNNEPTNLQTLCANCHRLKTFINKDWLKKD